MSLGLVGGLAAVREQAVDELVFVGLAVELAEPAQREDAGAEVAGYSVRGAANSRLVGITVLLKTDARRSEQTTARTRHSARFDAGSSLAGIALLAASARSESGFKAEGDRARPGEVFGYPWQPEFCDWAFNLPRGDELRAVRSDWWVT